MKNKKRKRKHGQSGYRGKVQLEELRQGGGIAHFRQRRDGEEQKMSLSRGGFYKQTAVLKPFGCGKCQICQKQKARDVPLFPGRTRTHRLDLELLSWAALMWSCRCPSSAQHSPFLVAFVPQNTFLDHHKPSIPLPDPTEKHICFKTVLFYDQLLGVDRCLAYFLSSIHEEERTNAHVNTGNDTNKNRK